MGNLSINTQTLHVGATYADESKNLRVEVNYDATPDTATVTSINGGFYKNDNYAGSFNGSRRDNGMEYSFGGVKLTDMTDAVEAVQNIEAEIASLHTED